VLQRLWSSNPWEKIEESDHPKNWDDRIPVVVLPESPEKVEAQLGQWLCDNLHSKRNTVRFLLPREGSENLFGDRDLIVLARAVQLAEQWKGQNPEYGRLQNKYQKELRDILRTRFDRFALISNWNFQEPKSCRFYIEGHKTEGSKIPDTIDQQISENLFIPEDFAEIVLAAAQNNVAVGKVLKELQEPLPNGADCIPWLGETEVKERVIRLCAQGKIAINLRGMEYLQQSDGESEDAAWRRMRSRLGTGKHLDETYILTPQAVAATGGVVPSNGQPVAAQPVPPILPGDISPSIPPATPFSGSRATSTIFGSNSDYCSLKAPATSALNLLGKTETWGISPGTQIRAMSLKVDCLTGAQLKDLLKKLPDGMTYELDLEKESQ
jgi:hypothetical protein